jgi:hypothetical protein
VRLRIVAAGLIALSLGLKLFGGLASPADDSAGALQALASNLTASGYTVQLELAKRTRVTATRGACRMVIKLLDPHATNYAAAIHTLSVEGRIAYNWRGLWRESLPRFGPLMEFYFKRELARHGLAASRHPVWIAALGPQCPDHPEVPFSDIEVALVPAPE